MKPVLGVCGQCRSYVFACHVDGVRVSADTTPLDLDGYRRALVAGRTTYRVHLDATGAVNLLSADLPSAASSLPRLVAHGCNAVPRPVEAPQTASGGACEAWTAQGWNPPRTCPRRGQGPGLGPQSCQHCEPPPF